MSWIDQLPPVLQPQLERLLATERDCIRIQVHAAPPDRRYQSALGRIMYWPVGKDWPRDENGRPLFGLLQINLNELPAALPGLPDYGMLQFFVNDDAFWGANPLAPQRQDNYRVVYHDEAEPAQTELLGDFSFLPLYEDLPLQRDLCYALTFTQGRMPMPPEDYRFESLLGDIFTELGSAHWETLNAYRKAIGTVGHRLGGYAGFAQEDPREASDNLPWELLLQLDTDPKVGLLWGDYGVAHWFTPQPAVATRSLDAPAPDFTQVWYGWESA